MDENNSSPCLTFLQHEAAYRSRVFKRKHKKKRLSARDLLNACVKLVDDYDCEALPDIAPDDHAKIVMPTLNVTDTDDQIFSTQVLYGCCRYRKLLQVLTTRLFSCKSPSIQCVDQTLYTVLGYLVLIRLEELTFENFRKFVLSQHPKKLLPFMQFVFSQEDLSKACKPEWIKIYDTEYVDSLIGRVSAWRLEADDLSRRLEEKVSVIKQQEKHSMAFKAFNLSTSQKKPTIIDENKVPLPPPLFKAKPPPVWKEGLTPTQKALEAVCKESREKLAKFYSSPKNQPFHLHILERPSKFSALKEQIEAVRKMETEYIPPRARPCPDPPRDPVKLTTSAMLREHSLYQKQLDEVRERLKAFEVDLRDDSAYKCWQEGMRSRDKILESVHRRFAKAAVDACDQAAADARNAKAEENREVVKKVKEESQKLEALKDEFLVNLELFNRLRRENVLEGQIAVKKNAKIAEKSAFVQKMRQLAHVRRLARKDENNLPHIPGSEPTEETEGLPP
ncbi:hypothetical protein GOP47_0018036 [Adiantum capillus-veneris]|uniref:Uncharacterized protein n=1 Tax=Adiantum capillus-veneris TaxID=13818 RepID=A0A9D4Z9S3_ADICA|nr:hypothetical protein GOP47_0018036 [Adiantum capillus-veneris]